MKAPPAFQFYADDFLAGTFDMSTEEVGAYIRLLCHQWNRGSIPVEPERQRRLAGGSTSDLVISKFKVGGDGLLRNQRLEDERAKQQAFRDRQSEKGKKSAFSRSSSTTVEPRLNHGSGLVQPRVVQPEGNSPSPSPSPSPITIPTKDVAVATAPKRIVFEKPTKEAMKAHAVELGMPDSEGENAWHFYESKGWKVGSQAMKCWKSALVTWRGRWMQNGGIPQPLKPVQSNDVLIIPGSGRYTADKPPKRDSFKDDSSFEASMGYYQQWLKDRKP